MSTPDPRAEAARKEAERIAYEFVTESSALPVPEHGGDCLNALEESIVKDLARYITVGLLRFPAMPEGQELYEARTEELAEAALCILKGAAHPGRERMTFSL